MHNDNIDILNDINYDIENTLNDDWIHKFEETDKLYQDFYKDDLYFTNINIIYIDINNNIEKIKQEMFLMSEPNTIFKEEIIGILNKYTTNENIRYSLQTILKYNITLDADEVKYYLLDKDTTNYLSVIKNIDDIKFDKSISMLHDLNELYFIFCEKSNLISKHNTNSITKKIVSRINNNKKSIKKRYKD